MNKFSVISVIRVIGFFLLFSIFLQIILGAWVRLTGSGMSCPDWPLCYGMLFPTPDKIRVLDNIEYTYFQIFLEWIHRANAAFIIGPICVMFSFLLIFKKEINNNYKKYAYFLILFLFIQGALGGVTVFKSNIPWSVAIHLLFAFLLYLTVLLIILNTYDIKFENKIYVKKYLKVNTLITGSLVLLTACAGAFTSKYGASLACSNWPKCEDSLLPNFKDMFQIIHFAHRVMALSLVIFLSILLLKLKFYIKNMTNTIKTIVMLILFIILLQVAIGALLIYFSVPIWMGIFHQATGLILFTLITILYFHIRVKQFS